MHDLRYLLDSLKNSLRRWASKAEVPKLDSLSGIKPTAAPTPSRPPVHFQLTPLLFEADLHELTAIPDWDWNRFRNVLVLLALIGKGRYIPADRRPDSICIDGLQPTILELQAISRQRQGRETSRVIFSDRDRRGLVVSGKTHVGTQISTRMIIAPEPGREQWQTPVLTVHIHPDVLTAGGFSDMDYVAFLADFRLVGMLMRFKEGVLLALKTSATRRHMAPDYSQRLIADARKEFLESYRMAVNPKQAVIDFNKTTCLEFGLTLYKTFDLFGNEAQRVTVVS